MPRGSRNICMQSEDTLEYAHCHNDVCNRTCLLGPNSCNSGFFFKTADVKRSEIINMVIPSIYFIFTVHNIAAVLIILL